MQIIKKILLIKDDTEHKIIYYQLLAFLVFLPFNRLLSEVVLISLIAYSLLRITKKKLRNISVKNVLLQQSVFILTLAGLFYTSYAADGFNDLSKQLSIFFFPLIFAVSTINIDHYRQQLMLAFALVCTFTAAGLYVTAFCIICTHHLPAHLLFTTVFMNTNFTHPIDLHPTYFSMYAALSLLFFVQQLITVPYRRKQIWYWICCIILSAALLQLSSKAVIFSVLFIFNVAFPFLYLKRKARLKFFTLSACITLLLVLVIFNNDVFNRRYIHGTEKDMVLSKANNTAADSRISRWKAALSLIKRSPLIGYGSGSETALLKQEYLKRKMYSSYHNELNVHNEYLSILFKTGLIGLFIFLSTLCCSIVIAIRKKDILFSGFMVLVCAVSISENIFDVNKGIFFYSFFLSFFLFDKAAQTQKPILNKA
jgi:O-antigen ligase